MSLFYSYIAGSLRVSGPEAHLQGSSYSCSHDRWFSFCAALCVVACLGDYRHKDRPQHTEHMFRAHRPIFRRVRTAVHTTIGSASVPLCSRSLCVVACVGDYSHQDRPQHTKHMFRAHRPIFRGVRTAVHTTIGSASVPLCSRALRVVACLGD